MVTVSSIYFKYQRYCTIQCSTFHSILLQFTIKDNNDNATTCQGLSTLHLPPVRRFLFSSSQWVSQLQNPTTRTRVLEPQLVPIFIVCVPRKHSLRWGFVWKWFIKAGLPGTLGWTRNHAGMWLWQRTMEDCFNLVLQENSRVLKNP